MCYYGSGCGLFFLVYFLTVTYSCLSIYLFSFFFGLYKFLFAWIYDMGLSFFLEKSRTSSTYCFSGILLILLLSSLIYLFLSILLLLVSICLLLSSIWLLSIIILLISKLLESANLLLALIFSMSYLPPSLLLPILLFIILLFANLLAIISLEAFSAFDLP